MEHINQLFSLDFHIFSVFGYKMSLIEFVGTIFGLLSVWLATKANLHTWTSGLVNVSLFFVIYFQVQLYSDMFLQVFFFVASLFGLWQWLRKKQKHKLIEISVLNNKNRLLIIGAIVVLVLVLGKFMSNIHLLFPKTFTLPSAYPYADAFTTALSIIATFLMAYKKIECWVLWVLLDVVSIYLYIQKDILFVAFEFAVFLLMSVYGYIHWSKNIKNA